MAKIQTVLGAINSKKMGFALPHEHLFFDLRGRSRPNDFRIERAEVIKTVLPSLLELKQKGVSTLFECSTGGIGRDHLILKALAGQSGINIVAPTGMYKEPFMPSWVTEKAVNDLADWMVEEITKGIEGTSIKAGFIKLAATDEGLTSLEERVLRASARAAKGTGVAIVDHTVSGTVLVQEVKVLREEQFNLNKFVWVHAHAEKDISQHISAAQMGINLEYDGIGGMPDDFFIGPIKKVVEKGYADRILISQDAGGYNAAEKGGGKPRPLNYIIENFLPRMKLEGMEQLIQQVTEDNPRKTFEFD